MVEESIYWKVLTQNRNSCVAASKYTTVNYPIGKWVRPQMKGSKLMIFNNIMLARKFVIAMDFPMKYALLVPCHARYVLPITFLPSFPYLDNSDIKTFWKLSKKLKTRDINKFDSDNPDLCIATTPAGTLGASMVKCLE